MHISLRYPCTAEMYLAIKKAERRNKLNLDDVFLCATSMLFGIVLATLFVVNF